MTLSIDELELASGKGLKAVFWEWGANPPNPPEFFRIRPKTKGLMLGSVGGAGMRGHPETSLLALGRRSGRSPPLPYPPPRHLQYSIRRLAWGIGRFRFVVFDCEPVPFTSLLQLSDRARRRSPPRAHAVYRTGVM